MKISLTPAEQHEFLLGLARHYGEIKAEQPDLADGRILNRIHGLGIDATLEDMAAGIALAASLPAAPVKPVKPVKPDGMTLAALAKYSGMTLAALKTCIFHKTPAGFPTLHEIGTSSEGQTVYYDKADGDALKVWSQTQPPPKRQTRTTKAGTTKGSK